MRWAPQNVDPMLSLRNLVCNKRWEEGWQQVVTHHKEHRRQARRKIVQAEELTTTEPVTFAALKKGLLPAIEKPQSVGEKETKTNRPAADHPWRSGLWPTQESWRWK
jgi:hypothetical protein